MIELKIVITPKQTKIDIGDRFTNKDIININKTLLISKKCYFLSLC